MIDYGLGIDLGATNIKIIAVSAQEQVLRQHTFPTGTDAVSHWGENIRHCIAEIEKVLGPSTAVGVCCPGLAARDGRSITWMQNRMTSIVGINFTSLLQRHVPVPVLNDAHAALLGEMWLGAAHGESDVVMLTLGTGVGGAIMSDGRLLKGRLVRAGHLGHISLDPAGVKDIAHTPGSLEDAIGECTLQRRAGGRYQSTAALVQAVVTGDAYARQVWLVSIRALAAGLVSIINAIDPQVIVLGGGITRAGTELLSPLRELMDEFEWRPTGEPVRIELARLGDMAGAFGAAHCAMAAITSDTLNKETS
jgi:glucokinase